LLIRLANHGPVIFKQERIGEYGKRFTMYKFRTMVIGAEKLKNKYKHLNHADGPVFKIRNDPRLTGFGKILVKTGLDELPQLINVLKGEMSIVGPRPLPVYEASQLTKAQKVRELVLPGITSSWVVSGAHNLKFPEWMRLDREYVEKANILTDVSILFKTAALITSIGIRKIISFFRS
jgi:lipopolysaccharide/colanic/teichoic acid biosynthesis glycosyltransferase